MTLSIWRYALLPVGVPWTVLYTVGRLDGWSEGVLKAIMYGLVIAGAVFYLVLNERHEAAERQRSGRARSDREPAT